VRRAKSIDAAWPWLYLKGVANGELQEALEGWVGPEAKGWSAGVVSRLKRQWEQEYEAGCKKRRDRTAGSMSGPTGSTGGYGGRMSGCAYES
jgi:hypothetical protein